MRAVALGAVLGLLSLGPTAAFAADPARPAAEVERGRPRLRVRFASQPGVAGDAVAVEVNALGVGGGLVDAEGVAVFADAGKVGPAERVATGTYRFTLAIPRQLPGTGVITVVARAGALHGEATLGVVAGPAAAVRIEGPSACQEGGEGCRLEVSALDAYGNPATEIPTLRAARGEVSPASSSQAGRWVATYRPPPVVLDAEDEVSVVLGPVRAAHRLRVAPARAELGFAGRAGAALQDGRLGVAVGGGAFALRRLASAWLLGGGVEVEWWAEGRSGAAEGPSSSVHFTADRSQLLLAAVALAERPVTDRLLLWASAGGGVARVTSTTRLAGSPSVSEVGWAPAATGAAALGVHALGGVPFLEARVAWVGDPHLDTLRGSVAPLFLQLGYRLDAR
jgi:hypothetical protein